MHQWRTDHEPSFPTAWTEILPIATSGAHTCAPLIAVALAGIESGRDRFVNQGSIVDDLLYPANWHRTGRTLVADFPVSVVFIYQALHGAACLNTEQPALALQLVTTNIELPGYSERLPLWRHHGVMGWPDVFEHRCTTAWEAVSSLSTKWLWLDTIFGDAAEYRASLAAYYMLLNVFEYVETLAVDNGKLLRDSTLRLDIPLCYESERDEITRRAYQMLTKNKAVILNLWRGKKISDPMAKSNWKLWVEICSRWLANVYQYSMNTQITHRSLMEDLNFSGGS
jgi:hypothetical protein